MLKTTATKQSAAAPSLKKSTKRSALTTQTRKHKTFSRTQQHNSRHPLPPADQTTDLDRRGHDQSNRRTNLADRLRSGATNHSQHQHKTSDLRSIVMETIEPPSQYNCEVPRLINALRQVISHDGPVSIGQIDENTPFIDPKSLMKHIPQPEDINWEAVPPFITSSRDPALYALAHGHHAHFMGSTSSTSPLLSQLHYALTSHAPIRTQSLSHWFANASTTHTRASVKPAVSLLRKRFDTIWGIDNAPSGDPKQNQILIDLGKSLERHLTFEWDDFSKFFLRHYDTDGNLLPPTYEPDEIQESEAHAFVKVGHLLLRSQLDCEDDSVPSDKKVFDLKTRATLPIRLDVMNHESYLDYKINTRHGLYNSFEREYYDMGRSAFLKYSFQCRIGGMGGVFVAYHNTRELFGFEYIPIEKMDEMVYGSSVKANFVFRHSLNLMEELMSRVTQDMGDPLNRPQKDAIRLTTDSMNGRLVVFAEKFPSVDLDDAAALDKAIACPYRGHVYIDWLSEDQARAALTRRGLSTEGSRPELISRLESVSVVPSVLYAPPAEDFLLDLMEKDLFKIYNMHINLFDERSQQYVEWSQLNDGVIPEISLRYSLREVNQTNHKPELARRYHQMLLEAGLMDRHSVPQDLQLPTEVEEKIFADYREKIREAAVDIDGNPIQLDQSDDDHMMGDLSKNPEVIKAIQDAKKAYMAEVVDHMELGGVTIPLTRADQLKINNKKIIMNNLMGQVDEYDKIEAMTDGTEKQMATQNIKVSSFQSNKRLLKKNQQQAQQGAPGVQQASEPAVHRRAL